MSQCFCLSCRASFKNDDDFDKHPCNPIFKMREGTITVELSKVVGLKRTRWGRFVDKVLSLDIGLGLSIMGLIIMNGVFLRHFHFTFWESLIEGLGWGLAIPRLLK